MVRMHNSLRSASLFGIREGRCIDLDRAGKTPLAVQIYGAIRSAIETGRLASGARLPSWCDLAAQLGVSRGIVRVAYERDSPSGASIAPQPCIRWVCRCNPTMMQYARRRRRSGQRDHSVPR